MPLVHEAPPQPSVQLPDTESPMSDRQHSPARRPGAQPPLPSITRQSTKVSQRLHGLARHRTTGTGTTMSSTDRLGTTISSADYGDIAALRHQMALQSAGTNSTLGGGHFLANFGSFAVNSSSDSLRIPSSELPVFMKNQPNQRHRGNSVDMNRAITERTEEDSDEVLDATEMEGEQRRIDFQAIDEKLNFLIEMMYKNMKYTRAIYQSTKKSLSGPGNEVGRLARDSMAVSTSGATHGRTVSPRSSDAPVVLAKATTRETLGRGSESAQKVSNMLELTRYIMRQKEKRSKRIEIGTSLWRFMEDRKSSRKAAAYALLNHFFLAASIVMACVDVIDLNVGNDGNERADNWTRPIAIGIECVFAVEIALRFAFCPHPRVFWLNRFNLIDAASALPVCLRIGTLLSTAMDTSDEINALLCLVPALRLCKLLRRFETYHLLASAFQTSFQALPAILFTMILIGLSFSALIYYVEPRSNVKNFSFAIWYVMVTMCGVAPGEPVPVTSGGKVCTVLLLLCGTLYMAIPIGIVGSAFSEVWQEKDRLLLLQRMRNCVERAGYTPEDLRSMFKLLDRNHDGSLDFKEFSSMLDVMQIGVEDQFIGEVFASFDDDCEGSIDFRELLRGLFPHSNQNYIMAQRLSEDADVPSKKTRYNLQGSFRSQYSSDGVSRPSWQYSCLPSGSTARNFEMQSSTSGVSKKTSYTATPTSSDTSPARDVIIGQSSSVME